MLDPTNPERRFLRSVIDDNLGQDRLTFCSVSGGSDITAIGMIDFVRLLPKIFCSA
jgi:hypothetical protein